MRLLLAFVAFSIQLLAQVATVNVRITSTPEPISSLYPVLHTKRIGLHTLRMCSQGAVPVTIPPEQIFMALHELPVISVDRAVTIINDAYSHNPKLQFARYVTFAGLGAAFVASGGFSAIAAATPRVIAGIAAGTAGAQMYADKLKGEVPQLGPFLGSVLNGNVTLAPAGADGYCATKTVFSGVIHGVKSYDVTVLVPVAPTAVPGSVVARPLSEDAALLSTTALVAVNW
jgi:hypothetical protein